MKKELGIYTIYSNGTIFSNKSNKFLKQQQDSRGYMRVGLTINGQAKTYKVHRLIADAFLPKENNKPQVNHKNGIKTNNRLENLEWCDSSHNMKHAYDNGLKTSHHNKVVLDTQTGVFYSSATELANLIGMNRATLISRLNGHRNVPTKYQYA